MKWSDHNSELEENWAKYKGRPREWGQGQGCFTVIPPPIPSSCLLLFGHSAQFFSCKQQTQRSVAIITSELKIKKEATNYVYFMTFPAASLSSVDLEQVCLSRLELAEIASQRHHALTSGNIVYACMRALEDAAILNELDLEKR